LSARHACCAAPQPFCGSFSHKTQLSGDSGPPQSCDVPSHTALHAPSQMQLLAAWNNIVEPPGHAVAESGSVSACPQCVHAPLVPVDALLEVVEAGAVVVALEVGVPPAPLPELDVPGSAIDPPHAATVATRTNAKRPIREHPTRRGSRRAMRSLAPRSSRNEAC
jgi:hypothetical protein